MKTETTAFLSHQEIFDRAAIHLQRQGRAGLLLRTPTTWAGRAWSGNWDHRRCS